MDNYYSVSNLVEMQWQVYITMITDRKVKHSWFVPMLMEKVKLITMNIYLVKGFVATN